MKSIKILSTLVVLMLVLSLGEALKNKISNCFQQNSQGCQICNPGFEPSWNRQKCIKFEQTNFYYQDDELEMAQNKTCNVTDCNVCVPGNPQMCQNCSSSYTLSQTNGSCFCSSSSRNCTTCEISNCRVCSSANICSDCNQNYALNLNVNQCISCAINSCNTCSSSNVCNSCNSGTPSLDGSVCVSFCPTGCSVCNAQNMCLGCAPGYSFNLGMTTCYQCNIIGCTNCNATNTCQMCASGYQLIQGNCIVCSPPCSLCNANGSCQTCSTPLYSSTVSNNNQCYQCQDVRCMTCQASNPSNCTACLSGSLLSGGNCVLLCNDFNCQVCSATNPNQCSSCMNYYYVSPSSGACNLCEDFPKCLACNPLNPANCTNCGTGYWSNNGVCTQCPAWCAVCTATTCTQTKISQGVVALNQGLILAACGYGCASCSSSRPSGCMACMNGFSLNQAGQCLPCIPPCATCQAGSPTICQSCLPGSAFVSGSCTLCSSSCKTCSSTNTNICTSCNYGVALNNGQCSGACSNNCITCTSPTNCLSCQQGFGLNATNFCVPCLTSCARCSGTFPTICLACGTGFAPTLNNLQQLVCNACPSNCMTCSLINSTSICSMCYPGYILNGGFACSQACSFPCATCQSKSPTICTSCFAGYTYNSASFSCANQLAFSNTSLTGICPLGYMLSGGQCVSCIGNCAACVNATNICTGCRIGFYLGPTNNLCLSCPVGCVTCTLLISCQLCSSGYFLPSATVNTPQVCQACQFPCVTCYGFANQCTSCQSGYTMNGWSCVTSYNLAVGAVLNTNFTAFFAKGPNNSSSNYIIYLKQLQVASLSPSLNNISISSLTSGSINTNSAISVQQSNSNAVLSSVDGLQSLLSSGTLGGSTIISFNIQASQGTLPANNGANLALILGITIPLAFVLILAIGILIYCKFKRQTNIIEKKMKNDGLTVRENFELSTDITGRRLQTI